jgi:pimeloyl-ACP methyl ester carboxylesterase
MKTVFVTLVCCLLGASLDAQIAPLDYANAANWSAHPMKLFDLNIKPSYTLIGADTSQKTNFNFAYPPANAEADIFVISPTTLISAGGAARTIPLDFTQKSAINFSIQLNFSFLGQIGRIYAPYYRQANLATFSLPASQYELQAAIFDTAASDALAAFKYYMQHDNGGRRVILAGHSQGALVAAMMLRRMEKAPAQYGTYLEKIFISMLAGMEGGAYAQKTELTGGWLETIPFCENAPDTACLMAWQTVKDGLPFNSNFPPGNLVGYNHKMTDKDLKFSAFNPDFHDQWGDPLGFSDTQKPVERAIFPKIYIATGAAGVTTDWVAYEGMYDARIAHPNPSAYAIAVEKTSPAGDQRHDPIGDAVFADLHLYDMYFAAGDVLRLVRQKLDGISPVKTLAGATASLKISPNPTQGLIKIETPENIEIQSVRVFDARGKIVLVSETGEIDLSEFPTGMYFLQAETKTGRISGKVCR